MNWALIEPGWWITGLATAGRGLVVANLHYVAFVPTERPKNLAAGAAWAGAGFVTVTVGGKISPQWVYRQLTAGPLDHQVAQLCSALNGQLWRPQEARAHERKIPLRRKYRGLWFHRGNQSIRLARTIGVMEFEQIRIQLRNWAWKP